MLKPVKAKPTFVASAEDVASNILSLQEFVQSTKADYVRNGRYSRADKDKIEEEVSETVRACGQQIDHLKNVVLTSQQLRPSQGAINEQTAAHMQGIVLILVERLHSVSASFDKCRAERYHQATVHVPKVTYTQEAAKLAGQAPPGEASWPGTPAGGSGQPAGQQAQMAQETRALLEELTSTAQTVHQVERSVREIAMLNNMLSTAVMQQAEQIEQLYDNTVNATFNVRRGNESLRKTIDVNRSSRMYIVVLLLVATFSLLFYDWFNS